MPGEYQCPNAKRYKGDRTPTCSGGKCEECWAVYREASRRRSQAVHEKRMKEILGHER